MTNGQIGRALDMATTMWWRWNDAPNSPERAQNYERYYNLRQKAMAALDGDAVALADEDLREYVEMIEEIHSRNATVEKTKTTFSPLDFGVWQACFLVKHSGSFSADGLPESADVQTLPPGDDGKSITRVLVPLDRSASDMDDEINAVCRAFKQVESKHADAERLSTDIYTVDQKQAELMARMDAC